MRTPSRLQAVRWSLPAVLLAAVLFVAVAYGPAAAGPAGQEKEPQAAAEEAVAKPEAAAAPAVSITVQPTFPSDIPGGAPSASLAAAGAFAWQEFIAATWPAKPGVRDTPDVSQRYGQPGYTGPLVWETYRGKVEIFPGEATQQPPGFVNDPATSYGYDAGPQYLYAKTIPPCSGTPSASTPWVNADEKSQIGLDQMYAGVGPPGVPGQQFVFLAKANRTQYVYSVQPRPNGPFRPYSGAPDQIDNKVFGLGNHATSGANPWETDNPAYNALVYNFAFNYQQGKAPVAPFVQFPAGTIEAKAAFRQLAQGEDASRYHLQTVRTYRSQGGGTCYVDEQLALAALHIIHKTPTAPYFVYATFSQADNLLTSDGKPVEDVNGAIINPPGTTPFTPDISTTASADGSIKVTLASGPAANQIESFAALPPGTTPAGSGPPVNCSPGKRLYYQNTPSPTPQGTVCVNQRVHPIPDTIQQVNLAAHQAITAYNQANGIASSPWLYYKLVNVQAQPMDKPPGVIYTGGGALDPSTYYQANEVVETDYNLQLFSGQFQVPFTTDPMPDVTNLITDYWQEGSPLAGQAFHNTYFDGKRYNMGGCMGCHGNAQVALGSDFSFILQGGRVPEPEAAGVPVGKETAVLDKYDAMRRQD